MWWIEQTVATNVLFGVFLALIGYFASYVLKLKIELFNQLLVVGALIMAFSVFSLFVLGILKSFI